jgi:two-component sensor histidine kinase
VLDDSINLLEEIDSVSKMHFLQRDDIDELMTIIGHRVVLALKIERISVWLFNQERDAIVSMGEFDLRGHKFSKNKTLLKKDFPKYFNAISGNKILLAENIYTNPATDEFSESYSKPNDIISLMDIPLRIAGELVGVMCFEKTGSNERIFSSKEQTFAFSMALVFASNLEARHRRAAQHKLEEAITEKELLIKEINHRVKNNFSILIGLLRLSKVQGKTTDPKVVLDEYEQRVFSMMKIQDLLYQSKNYTTVDLHTYINELVYEFRRSHPELSAAIESSVEELSCALPSKTAIHLGLIITEIFLNSVKHSSAVTPNYKLTIQLKERDDKSILLRIGDNGKGFSFTDKSINDTLGLPLIKDLANGVVRGINFPVPGNSYYELVINAGS